MLNIPAGLSDEERGIYKVCFTACEKLINEGKTIAEAVDAAIAKYSFLVSDVNELRRFLYAEITVYSEPTVAQSTRIPIGGQSAKQTTHSRKSILSAIMTICVISRHGVLQPLTK